MDLGFPCGASAKESSCQYRRCKRHGFDPWVGEIPWSEKWNPTPVFLPRKFHGQEARQAIVHGVEKRQKWLKRLNNIYNFYPNLLFTLILCCPLLLPPSIFPSIRVFSNESVLWIRWPKYWSFRISPSNELSGLVSFTIDQFDLLAVQGTLKSLLQHHNLKTSVLQHSAFFMLQLSGPYMILEKP